MINIGKDKHKELVNNDYYYYLYYDLQDYNYNFGDNKLDLEKAPSKCT